MPKVVPLCGPGVKGLEHCPPMYHFDVTAEESAAFLANPHGVAQAWRVPGEITNVVMVRPNEAWDDKKQEWVPRPKNEQRPLCYVKNSDGAVYIHCH